MYMNLEVVLIIGAFALLATAAGWARMLYFAVRKVGVIQEDSHARAVEARRAFKASQTEQARSR